MTRGVASVSSPVANLRKWSDTITPESFIEGAVDEFNRTYGGDDLAEVSKMAPPALQLPDGEVPIKEVDEDVLRTNDFVREGADELRVRLRSAPCPSEAVAHWPAVPELGLAIWPNP